MNEGAAKDAVDDGCVIDDDDDIDDCGEGYNNRDARTIRSGGS